MKKLLDFPDFVIISKGNYFEYLSKNDISTFHELIHFVQKIPYGRNSVRNNFALIFTENKATCSTKHGFLMEICELNKVVEVELMVGIFLMNENYSPKIKSILTEAEFDSIPEAHCYLRFNNQRFDFTTEKSDVSSFEPFLIREQRCDSQQVFDWKPMIHKNFLEAWLKRKKLNYTLEEIWKIREKCITKLSENA